MTYPKVRHGSWAATLAMVVAFGGPVCAEETPDTKDDPPSLAGMILLTEAVFAANAGLATLDPQVYGGVAALLFPVAAFEIDNQAMRWTSLAAAEGLAAYNIVALEKDEDSDKDIFVANMVAWHAFAAIAGTTWLIVGEGDGPPKASFQYRPLPDGGFLKVAYRF